jgi:hypothetical protein
MVQHRLGDFEAHATLLRQRGEYLGTVEAPDAKTAEAIAVK